MTKQFTSFFQILVFTIFLYYVFIKKKIKIFLFSIFVHFFKILSQKFLTLRQKKKKQKKTFSKMLNQKIHFKKCF